MDSAFRKESPVEYYFKHAFHKKLLPYMPQKEKEQLTHATEILKKCEDLDDMEKAKKIQQEGFRLKMECLEARKKYMVLRKNNLKRSLIKFDTFIKENDAKMIRAQAKAERDRKAVHVKEQEITVLLKEKEDLQSRLSALKKQVARHEKFHTFMHSVMVEVGGSVGGSGGNPYYPITRHSTLLSLLIHLQSKDRLNNTMLESLDPLLCITRDTLQDEIMALHNTVSKLQKRLELAQNNRLYWENECTQAFATSCEKTLLEGKLRMLIPKSL